MRLEPYKRPFQRSTPDQEKQSLEAILQQRKEKIFGKKRDTNLHSKDHLLADDLSKMMGEQKRFASYLGIAKLHYESDLRALARYVLEKDDLPTEARGRYFFGAVKNLKKIPGAKLKPRKKRKKGEKKTNGKNTNRKRAQ